MAAFERISVIGLGYVGLPTAATIAARGVRVLGVDIRPDVVERINSGRTHIMEPDLDIMVSMRRFDRDAQRRDATRAMRCFHCGGTDARVREQFARHARGPRSDSRDRAGACARQPDHH